MMLEINLQEHTSGRHRLSADQLEALLQKSQNLQLSVEPDRGSRGRYILRPGSIVGALEFGDVSILIEPKIGIPKLLSLVCYVMGIYKAKEQHSFNFKRTDALPDILALALTSSARRAFGKGLLRGYLAEEDALYTVRGRIQFSEQIRRRYSIPLPVELGFDEFTQDILANRLVKAAAARLSRMKLRSPEARRGLGWINAILETVSFVDFHRRVPEVRCDRLNEHYRHVVGLARLILLHSEFESKRGDVLASGFLIDMNRLFQEFVTQALREELGVTAATLQSQRKVSFDQDGLVKLEPDLSWWNGGKCIFVGDAKYKRIDDRTAPNADLYQILAYAIALDVPSGLLIYAKGEADTAQYRVKHSGKLLEVVALELSGSFEEILERVKDIAHKVKHMTERSAPRAIAS